MYELFGNEIIDRKDLEMKEKILVFIPMYNCEKQIVRVLDQLNGEIKKYISEAIIVNNRSTDNGEQAAIEKIKKMNAGFPIKVLKNRENYGLGGSHKVAFNYAIENNFDYIIGMDSANIRNLNRVLKNDPEGKIYKFLTFAGSGRDIADPWYTGNFDETYEDIQEGCEGFLDYLEKHGEIHY